MSRGALVLASVAIALTACGQAATESASTRPPTTTAATATTLPAVPDEGDRAAVLGLALQRLVTVDGLFGPGHVFAELLVQSHLDPAAGTAVSSGVPGRALTATERAAIEAALSALAPVRWIDDPAEWRTEDLRPTVEGAAILGVGEPRFDQRGGLVPVSLWCGGLCGTWLSYRLARAGGVWSVTGIEGPVAVS